MKNRALFLLVTVIFSTQAFASFLRLVPNIKISPADGKPGTIAIAGTVENQGDEAAQDVMVESVRSGKILIDIGSVGAGEEKDVTAEISEKDIGVEKEGYYNVPLRVLYKDGNHVSFSAAFINAYVKKGDSGTLGRSSPITLRLDEVVQKTGAVDIAKSGAFDLFVVNTGASPVEIGLEFVGTKEIEIKTKEGKIQIGPQQEKTVRVEVRNISALPGSNYASYALVSGVVDGQTFSDYIGFVVNVRAKADIPILTWLLVALALTFGVVGFLYWRKEAEDEKEE